MQESGVTGKMPAFLRSEFVQKNKRKIFIGGFIFIGIIILLLILS